MTRAPTSWSADDGRRRCSRSTASPGSGTSTPGALRTDRFDPSGFSVSVIYLDDDPVAHGGRIAQAPVITLRLGKGDGIAPRGFAAPFARDAVVGMGPPRPAGRARVP